MSASVEKCLHYKRERFQNTGEELHWQNQNIIRTLAFLWQDRFGD